MTIVGFHASHEQIPPSRLLRDVQDAEAAGFDAAMCSDHFSPWITRQGHSGYAWSWLAAALATTRLSFGVVTAPGQRYHPAVLAQKIATLAEMFPGRFRPALGSGEYMNEHITGEPWPPKDERNERLGESVDIIRRLLAGEEVSRSGLVTVDRARVWSAPEVPPALVAAAVSPETAAWAAGWADGLITVAQEPDALRRVIGAYRDAGGRGPCVLQVHLSYASDDAAALGIAHDQWRCGVIGPPRAWDIATADEFDAATADVAPEDVLGAVIVSSEPERHVERIAELVRIGFDEVYLHHVGQEQAEFLAVFGEHVVPRLKEAT